MEIINPTNITTNEQELSITQLQSRPSVPDGLYRAIFTGYTTFLDKTPWGEKKAVKMFFTLISGPAKNAKLSFKAFMILDQSTNKWIIGPRSKIAAAIKAINPYGNSINASNINTPVYVRVMNKESKKTGDLYPVVDEVLPMPPEESAKIINILKEILPQSNTQTNQQYNGAHQQSMQSQTYPQHQTSSAQFSRDIQHPMPQSTFNTSFNASVIHQTANQAVAKEFVAQPQNSQNTPVAQKNTINQQNSQVVPEHILEELENLGDYLE